jgi:hypothetical protein
MRKILIVIDMQNDFIDGALGTPEAAAIVENVKEKIRSYPKEDVFATRDSHTTDYMYTQEGKNLPVPHCIRGTDGWQIRPDIAELIFPDGGGVTINHPVWSAYDRNLILRILDHDPRVLGMEIIEGGRNNGEGYWDWVLATGRQCFGFCVPDHSIRLKTGTFGVNVLVTPERTVHACLKAYRDGNFYGAFRGLNELKFTRIAFDGTTVAAETDKPARLVVITGCGVVKEEQKATSVTWTMEDAYASSAPRKNAHVFARIKAYALDGSGEQLFSQPYMLV